MLLLLAPLTAQQVGAAGPKSAVAARADGGAPRTDGGPAVDGGPAALNPTFEVYGGTAPAPPPESADCATRCRALDGYTDYLCEAQKKESYGFDECARILKSMRGSCLESCRRFGIVDIEFMDAEAEKLKAEISKKYGLLPDGGIDPARPKNPAARPPPRK